MIRIKTEVDGWQVKTIYFNEEWVTMMRKEGEKTFSTSAKSYFDAGSNHLIYLKIILGKRKPNEQDDEK